MSANEGRTNEVQREAHRNDFLDVAVGFAVSFGFFLLLATVATIVTLVM
jgi:hypothetical protein